MSYSLCSAEEGERLSPHNVILFIGDGMGFEHIRMTRLADGEENFSFEIFPYSGQVTTYSADNLVTDSAAAATAIATGRKVNNGVVSLAIPGDGSELQTLLEYFKARGKSVGLITTVTTTHATPACFGAHESSRGNMSQIAQDYLLRSQPMVVMGGGGDGMSINNALAADYTVVTTRASMLELNLNATEKLMGLFGNGYMPYEGNGLGDLPHLHEMVSTALSLLDDNSQGFFLMVEGGLIDQAAHANNAALVAGEVREFDQAVRAALSWLPAGSETLILVTADHETGGLSVVDEALVGGLPTVTWSTGGHTAANVPLFATGYGAESFSGTLDNTDFFSLITRAGLVYNQAPIVNAGANAIVEIESPAHVPVELELQGAVSDDAISTGPVQTEWLQASGPEAAQIKSPAALTSRVQFSALGNYIFKLQADDGFERGEHSVQIAIQLAATPTTTGTSTPTEIPSLTPTAPRQNTLPPTATPTATQAVTPTMTVPSIEPTLAATPSPVTTLELRRKISAGGQRIMAKTYILAGDGTRSSYRPHGCYMSFYLISSKHPEAARSNRLTRMAARAQVIFELPLFQRQVRRNVAGALSVELQAQMTCPGKAAVSSRNVQLANVQRRYWPALLQFWRQALRISPRW